MRWDGSSKGSHDWDRGIASVRHRFERQRPDVEEISRHRNKKDTRRWCRGKVGVEHETELIVVCSFFSYHRCRRCGKKYI